MSQKPERKLELPLHPGSYRGDASWLNSFTCVNLYPEKLEADPKENKVALVGTPGLKKVATIGTGPHRSASIHINKAYIVSGNGLYSYDTDGAYTLIGTLNTASGAVYMSSNGTSGNQLTITDGVNGYIYNTNTLVFGTITAPDFPINPLQNKFLEGYTIVNSVNTDYWQISGFYDSSSWSNGDKARAERDPDNLLALAVYNRQLWLLGEDTIEVWYNSGNDFPFDHVPNGLIEWGVLAPASVCNTGNYGVVCLAVNRFGMAGVIRSHGYSLYNTIQGAGASSGSVSLVPQTIMSVWRTYSTLSDAIGLVYQEHGHVFYMLTFPTANKTWVYDFTNEMWHERKCSGGRHRANSYIFFNGKHLVGDYDNGNLYQLDMDTFTDNSSIIEREFTTAHVTQSRQQVKHNYLEIELEAGMGTLSGQGVTPVMSLDISDDGGHTYRNTRTLSLGTQGQYARSLRWPMLGAPRDRVYKVSFSDPIKWRIKRAILDFEERNH